MPNAVKALKADSNMTSNALQFTACKLKHFSNMSQTRCQHNRITSQVKSSQCQHPITTAVQYWALRWGFTKSSMHPETIPWAIKNVPLYSGP